MTFTVHTFRAISKPYFICPAVYFVGGIKYSLTVLLEGDCTAATLQRTLRLSWSKQWPKSIAAERGKIFRVIGVTSAQGSAGGYNSLAKHNVLRIHGHSAASNEGKHTCKIKQRRVIFNQSCCNVVLICGKRFPALVNYLSCRTKHLNIYMHTPLYRIIPIPPPVTTAFCWNVAFKWFSLHLKR